VAHRVTPADSTPPRFVEWPKHALIFDTGTRITEDQGLTFGVLRLCQLQGNKYTVTREGIFYADDLPAGGRKIIENYPRTALSDVKTLPPEFPLYSPI
jgi:hypothetical protein